MGHEHRIAPLVDCYILKVSIVEFLGFSNLWAVSLFFDSLAA